MTTANTRECWAEFVGQRVVGVMFDALPVNRRDIASGGRTLIFEDGRGLTVSSRGSFWVDSAEDVTRAVKRLEDELRDTTERLAGALSLASVPGVSA